MLSILFVILYGISNSLTKSTSVSQEIELPKKINKSRVYRDNQKDIVKYIVDVINNGSARFYFKGGVMEGGYIPKENAADVACFVYELSGKKCNKSYAKDAELYFSSSCAGCHGSDGKGIDKTYPNLSKNPLLGITK